jgi:hypothetical protein
MCVEIVSLGKVDEQHLESAAREQHGGRGSGTPRADDDGVVHRETSALTDITQRGRASTSDGLPKFGMSWNWVILCR